MKKKSNNQIVFVAILLGITFFIIYISTSNSGKINKTDKQKAIKKVDAVIIKPTEIIDEITVSGSLLAFDEVELRNEVPGRIVKMNLPEGEFVKKGTLLVKLFDEDLQANLKKLETQYSMQKQVFQRQSELLKVDGISKNEFEQTEVQLHSIEADIEIQKTLIRKTEVLAPFDGIIGLRYISVGAIATTSTLLATIRTNNKLKLDFFVPEKYSSTITNGMKVQFTMYDNQTWYTATVIATEFSIDNETRNLKVRALVENRSKKLIPGVYTTVKLQFGKKTNATVIPSQAIIPQEKNKQVIIAQNGKAHFVSVKTGIRKSSGIEILEGIQPGDTIIISGILFLKEGSKLIYASIKK